jgi:predicted Fe-Mo cluster-binding NifX family protein
METDSKSGRRIAISSTGKSLKNKVAEVFGRCSYFFIAEIQNSKIIKSEVMENIVASQMGGAGVAAAQAVAEKNVDVLIAGNVGPRAMDVLRQFKIEIYNGDGSVEEVLQKFMDGKLKRIQ